MTTSDAATFTSLVERHRGELHGHCHRMLGSPADADDAVQETFLRAWRSRTTLRERSTARPWLYRIATNACLDTLARRRPTAGEEALATLVADPDEQPDARVETTLAFDQALLAAVQHLPPRQRTVLILTDVLGWRARETAELLGDSVPAVRSALQRARTGAAGPLAEALGRYAA